MLIPLPSFAPNPAAFGRSSLSCPIGLGQAGSARSWKANLLEGKRVLGQEDLRPKEESEEDHGNKKAIVGLKIAEAPKRRRHETDDKKHMGLPHASRQSAATWPGGDLR